MECIIAKTSNGKYRLNLDMYGKNTFLFCDTAKGCMVHVTSKDRLVFDESITDNEMLSILLGII